MTSSEVVSMLQTNPGYVAGAVVYAGTYLHKYLGKYPVAQVLLKYASIVPILKLVALDVAQVIVATYGPDLVSIEQAVKQQPAQVPVVQKQEMKAAPAVQDAKPGSVPPYG